MAVDLKNNSLFQRQSLVLDPDSLIKLEHCSNKDRIRKVMFNRMGQVLVWRRFPVVRMIVVTVVLGCPGLLLLLVRETAAVVFALILLLLAGTILAIYAICRKTTIRLIRAGRVEDITGIFSPRKVRKLVANMVQNIRDVQARGFAEMYARQRADAAPAQPGDVQFERDLLANQTESPSPPKTDEGDLGR